MAEKDFISLTGGDGQIEHIHYSLSRRNPFWGTKVEGDNEPDKLITIRLGSTDTSPSSQTLQLGSTLLRSRLVFSICPIRMSLFL